MMRFALCCTAAFAVSPRKHQASLAQQDPYADADASSTAQMDEIVDVMLDIAVDHREKACAEWATYVTTHNTIMEKLSGGDVANNQTDPTGGVIQMLDKLDDSCSGTGTAGVFTPGVTTDPATAGTQCQSIARHKAEWEYFRDRKNQMAGQMNELATQADRNANMIARLATDMEATTRKYGKEITQHKVLIMAFRDAYIAITNSAVSEIFTKYQDNGDEDGPPFTNAGTYGTYDSGVLPGSPVVLTQVESETEPELSFDEKVKKSLGAIQMAMMNLSPESRAQHVAMVPESKLVLTQAKKNWQTDLGSVFNDQKTDNAREEMIATYLQGAAEKTDRVIVNLEAELSQKITSMKALETLYNSNVDSAVDNAETAMTNSEAAAHSADNARHAYEDAMTLRASLIQEQSDLLSEMSRTSESFMRSMKENYEEMKGLFIAGSTLQGYTGSSDDWNTQWAAASNSDDSDTSGGILCGSTQLQDVTPAGAEAIIAQFGDEGSSTNFRATFGSGANKFWDTAAFADGQLTVALKDILADDAAGGFQERFRTPWVSCTDCSFADYATNNADAGLGDDIFNGSAEHNDGSSQDRPYDGETAPDYYNGNDDFFFFLQESAETKSVDCTLQSAPAAAVTAIGANGYYCFAEGAVSAPGNCNKESDKDNVCLGTCYMDKYTVQADYANACSGAGDCDFDTTTMACAAGKTLTDAPYDGFKDVTYDIDGHSQGGADVVFTNILDDALERGRDLDSVMNALRVNEHECKGRLQNKRDALQGTMFRWEEEFAKFKTAVASWKRASNSEDEAKADREALQAQLANQGTAHMAAQTTYYQRQRAWKKALSALGKAIGQLQELNGDYRSAITLLGGLKDRIHNQAAQAQDDMTLEHTEYKKMVQHTRNTLNGFDKQEQDAKALTSFAKHRVDQQWYMVQFAVSSGAGTQEPSLDGDIATGAFLDDWNNLETTPQINQTSTPYELLNTGYYQSTDGTSGISDPDSLPLLVMLGFEDAANDGDTTKDMWAKTRAVVDFDKCRTVAIQDANDLTFQGDVTFLSGTPESERTAAAGDTALIALANTAETIYDEQAGEMWATARANIQKQRDDLNMFIGTLRQFLAGSAMKSNIVSP